MILYEIKTLRKGTETESTQYVVPDEVIVQLIKAVVAAIAEAKK